MYLGARAGQQLGGLLSGPNPAVMRSVLVQDALREANQSGTEIGTPKYFETLTKALAQRNLANDAIGVQQHAASLEATSAKGALERAQAINQLAQAQKALKSPALEHLPDAEKYRVLLENEQSKPGGGNPQTVAFYQDMIKKRSQTETAPQQEWVAYLQDLRTKVQGGYAPTPNEMGKARVAYNTLVQEKIDPATGARIQPPPVPELNPYENFGIGKPPPSAALAPPPRSEWRYTQGEAKPGEAELKVLSEGDALRGHLQDLDKLYKPDFVGPISGRLGYAAAATIGNEPQRAEFIAQANLYKNRLIKFITGAQMSEVETKRLINEIPDALDPPATFEAKRKISEKNIDYVNTAYQQNMKQGGVRRIGGNPVSPNARVEGAQGTPVPVGGPNDPAYARLPSGAQYQRPDGSVWTKQ
jgi:hypothetical protein